jgi:hypothetical protein
MEFLRSKELTAGTERPNWENFLWRILEDAIDLSKEV